MGYCNVQAQVTPFLSASASSCLPGPFTASAIMSTSASDAWNEWYSSGTNEIFWQGRWWHFYEDGQWRTRIWLKFEQPKWRLLSQPNPWTSPRWELTNQTRWFRRWISLTEWNAALYDDDEDDEGGLLGFRGYISNGRWCNIIGGTPPYSINFLYLLIAVLT